MSLRATIAMASACIGASTFIGVPLSMPVSIAGKELTQRSRCFCAKSEVVSALFFETMTLRRATFLPSA